MARQYEHAGPDPRSPEAVRRATGAPTNPRALHHELSAMKPGEVRSFAISRGSAPPAEVKVGYHAEQSYGDDAKPVRGAQIGYYHVHHNGHTRFFEHGPFALTDAAAKRGASRDSKHLIAMRAADHIHGLA